MKYKCIVVIEAPEGETALDVVRDLAFDARSAIAVAIDTEQYDIVAHYIEVE